MWLFVGFVFLGLLLMGVQRSERPSVRYWRQWCWHLVTEKVLRLHWEKAV